MLAVNNKLFLFLFLPFAVFQNGDLKLVGGTASAGRLEVYYDNQWGTVCNDNFDENNKAASVACRQLGFASGSLPQWSSTYGYGADSVPIWMDDVQCTGLENRLTDCTHAGLMRQSGCFHFEDVAVVCSGRYMCPSLTK